MSTDRNNGHGRRRHENELQADRGYNAVYIGSDNLHLDVGWINFGTDIADTIANLYHLMDRYGLDHDEVMREAIDSYLEDVNTFGGHVRRRTLPGHEEDAHG